MTHSERNWWERQRAKGYNRFLLRHGILKRGLPFGVATTLIFGVAVRALTHRPGIPIWKLLAQTGVYVLAFGLAAGSWSWSKHEEEFQKREDSDPPH